MLKALQYLKSRLRERSFWLQIGTAIVPAAILPWPWSAGAVAVSIVAMLVPDGSIETKTNP